MQKSDQKTQCQKAEGLYSIFWNTLLRHSVPLFILQMSENYGIDVKKVFEHV